MSKYYVLDNFQPKESTKDIWESCIRLFPVMETILENGYRIYTFFTGVGTVFWSTYIDRGNGVEHFLCGSTYSEAVNNHKEACYRYSSSWEVNGF